MHLWTDNPTGMMRGAGFALQMRPLFLPLPDARRRTVLQFADEVVALPPQCSDKRRG